MNIEIINNGCETWFRALKEEHNTKVGGGNDNDTAYGTVCLE